MTEVKSSFVTTAGDWSFTCAANFNNHLLSSLRRLDTPDHHSMDKEWQPLSTSREPNPLRPYYVPPSIGKAAGAPNSTTSPLPNAPRPPTSSPSLSNTARDILPELDLSAAGEAWQSTRSLFDALVYRYTSVLLAQPFDVAKLVLQVSKGPSLTAPSTPKRTTSARQSYDNNRARHREDYSEEEDDRERSESEDDIPDYFSATAPRSRSPRRRGRAPPSEELSPSPTPTPRDRKEQDPTHEYKLQLKRPDSVTHAISAIYNTSGAIGLWRATNCTFLYNALLRTTDSFLRSLLLAILGLPDIPGPDQSGLAPALGVPGSLGFSGLDLSDSPNVIGSLVVVGLSSCLAGLLLSPLDLVRTRLIVTPMSHSPRGLVQNLRRLPSLVAPSSLWFPTALSHTIPQIFSAATPLVLRRQLKITPENAPSIWSLAAFTTCLTDLFLRLPLETVVRRAQVASLREREPQLPLVIDAAPYTNVSATVYSILYQEGETRGKDSRGMTRITRGQGAGGLTRGWRVGFWGLVGAWGAGALGPGETKGRGEF